AGLRTPLRLRKKLATWRKPAARRIWLKPLENDWRSMQNVKRFVSNSERNRSAVAFACALASLLFFSIEVARSEMAITNGPVVYRLGTEYVTNVQPPWPAMSYRPPGTNLPPELRRALMSFLLQGTFRISTRSNAVF